MALKINYPNSYEDKMNSLPRKIGNNGYNLSYTDLEDIAYKYFIEMQRRIDNIGDELYKRAFCGFIVAKLREEF